MFDAHRAFVSCQSELHVPGLPCMHAVRELHMLLQPHSSHNCAMPFIYLSWHVCLPSPYIDVMVCTSSNLFEPCSNLFEPCCPVFKPCKMSHHHASMPHTVSVAMHDTLIACAGLCTSSAGKHPCGVPLVLSGCMAAPRVHQSTR